MQPSQVITCNIYYIFAANFHHIERQQIQAKDSTNRKCVTHTPTMKTDLYAVVQQPECL